MTISALANDIDPRFFITKNKFVTYEFSAYAKVLGEGFVESACSAVVDQKVLAGINERTWMNNYVIRLAHLLSAINDYKQTIVPTKDVADFDESEWIEVAPEIRTVG